MTKYVEELTKEIMKIMASNCGQHFGSSCQFTDEQLVKETEGRIREALHEHLKMLFDYLSDTIPITKQEKNTPSRHVKPDDG